MCSRQPNGTIEDVEEALDAAKAAQKAWEKVPAVERGEYLKKIAAGVKERRDEFIEIIMREQGKTRTWATIEVDATIGYFDYMASFARHIEGEIIPTTILAFRASYGAAQPTDVFIPILLATTVATLAGIIITATWQRINIFLVII